MSLYNFCIIILACQLSNEVVVTQRYLQCLCYLLCFLEDLTFRLCPWISIVLFCKMILNLFHLWEENNSCKVLAEPYIPIIKFGELRLNSCNNWNHHTICRFPVLCNICGGRVVSSPTAVFQTLWFFSWCCLLIVRCLCSWDTALTVVVSWSKFEHFFLLTNLMHAFHSERSLKDETFVNKS